MTTEHDPYEAGLGFAVRMDKGDFVGRDALVGKSAETAERRLVPLLIEDPAAVVMGKEPVHVDGRPAGYVTSAGVRLHDRVGHRVCLAAGRGRATRRSPSRSATSEKPCPATVATEPLFDPEMRRLRS